MVLSDEKSNIRQRNFPIKKLDFEIKTVKEREEQKQQTKLAKSEKIGLNRKEVKKNRNELFSLKDLKRGKEL